MVGEVALAMGLFAVIVGIIVVRLVEEAAAGLLGAVLMVALLSSYTVEDAFHFIDWDIIAILLGMWIITGYMIRAGLAEYVVSVLLRFSRSYRRILVMLALASGFLSILVDNVIVILIFGSIAARLAKRAGGDPVLAVMLIGLSANFMGTALLMGDLPPQLLHGIAGMEFNDFIVWQGAPSSFPLLTLTFLGVLATYYMLYIKREPDRPVEKPFQEETQVNTRLLALSTTFFIATIIGMAIRPRLGVPLGFITLSGAAALSFTAELLRRLGARRFPEMDYVLAEVEWRALLFYASLFALVGGLEASGALGRMASALLPYLGRGVLEGYSVSYWVVAGLSTIVEHDALLITFLYMARDAAHSIPYTPEVLYWGMAWSATLASNLTTAAAPALYVAVTIAEQEFGSRLPPSRILRLTAPFVLASLVIHFVVTLALWLPLVIQHGV